MYNNPYNCRQRTGQSIGWDRNRQIRAEQRNTSHDRRVRRALEDIKKLNKELKSTPLEERIMNFLRKYSPKTKEEKILAATLLGIVITGLVAYGVSKLDRTPPSVKKLAYRDRVMKGEKQNLTAILDEKNPAQNLILKLNGTSLQVPQVQDFKNGTSVYNLPFDPSVVSKTEGMLVGNLTSPDEAGNKDVQQVSFLANLQPPKVEDPKVERLALGKYRISANVTDENLRQVRLDFENGTSIPMTKVNGRYAANVTVTTNLNCSIVATDACNLTTTKSITPLRYIYEASLPEDSYKELYLSLFDQSPLFRELVANKMDSAVKNIQNVAAVNGSSIPKNLAYQVLKQIENDQRVGGKVNLGNEVFKLYVDSVEKVQKMAQIYAMNNATEYFGSAEKLRSEIGNEVMLQVLEKLGKNDGLNIDFDTAREHASLFRAAKYVNEILNHPKDWKELATEVDEIVYKHGFDKVNGEDYPWEKFVGPAASFIEGQRAKGIIKAPDGEIDVLHVNLLQVDIKTGKYYEIGREPNSVCLAVGVGNVNPDGSGKSPLEQLFDLEYKHYTNRTKTINWIGKKWSPYDIAIYSAYKRGEGLAINWPHCAARYKTDLDSIMAEQGDLAPFIIGEPFFLRGNFPEQIVPDMDETTIPHFTTLVAYPFGVKARTISAIYPSGGAKHDEPALRVGGKWFSFFGWNDKYPEFKKDYIGKPVNPHLEMTGTDGEYVEVDLTEN